MKKTLESAPHATAPVFKERWSQVLAEYMMTQAPFVRRQVRKVGQQRQLDILKMENINSL